jgi:hypothetical protein
VRIPTLQGVIRRRILVNYRVDPMVVERLLPARFTPKLHKGFALAGICLIRLERLRPTGFPGVVGLCSENAAHRVAVTWTDQDGQPREGVYIPRRDSDSRLNYWAGGLVFPGEHHRATFRIDDGGGRVDLRMQSTDAAVHVAVSGSRCDMLPEGSIFDSVADASDFFAAGSLGYSPTRNPCRFDGLILEVADWHVEPFAVSHVASSYFDDSATFPPDSVTFDHALVMRNLAHCWRSADELAA